MKCCICGFNGTEKFVECPRCLFYDRYKIWFDLRKKEDRIAVWKVFGHWIGFHNILRKGDLN